MKVESRKFNLDERKKMANIFSLLNETFEANSIDANLAFEAMFAYCIGIAKDAGLAESVLHEHLQRNWDGVE